MRQSAISMIRERDSKRERERVAPNLLVGICFGIMRNTTNFSKIIAFSSHFLTDVAHCIVCSDIDVHLIALLFRSIQYFYAVLAMFMLCQVLVLKLFNFPSKRFSISTQISKEKGSDGKYTLHSDNKLVLFSDIFFVCNYHVYVVTKLT